MVNAFIFVLVVAIGYVFGSFCSAIIVSRIFGLPDPRTEGSKNPGATNVLRLAGKKYAVIVLVADMLKGLLPVLLAKLIGAGVVAVGFTCFAAVLGHMYPVFFEFKGGKGVATAMGALLGLNFILGVLVIATWLIVAQYARYSSLASIVSMVLMPLFSTITVANVQIIPPLFFITIFVLYQHRNNIARLIEGTEPKIQFRPGNLSDVTNELFSTTEPSKTSSDEEEEEKKAQSETEKKDKE